jgi:hypothetical protein
MNPFFLYNWANSGKWPSWLRRDAAMNAVLSANRPAAFTTPALEIVKLT